MVPPRGIAGGWSGSRPNPAIGEASRSQQQERDRRPPASASRRWYYRGSAPVKGLQILVDEDQGTAVVLQLFDTAEDMHAGAQVFAAMDPAETPGTRAS